MTNLYETMYILRPDLGEEQVDAAIGKYRNILQEQGATDVEIQHRGKRRLAYEIGKHRDGIYIQMNYKAQGKEIAIVERAMRLSEEVVRYLTIKQEAPDDDKEEVAPQPVEVEVSHVPQAS